jgi:ketosteroid isomerase-like protein
MQSCLREPEVPVLKRASPALLGIAALAACAPSAPPGQASAADDEAAIREGGDGWNTACSGGDVDELVALYAEDAVSAPPDVPAGSGSAAIREFLAKGVAEAKSAGISVKDNGRAVGLTAELGRHAGKYSASDATGKTVSAGNYVELWRKKDGA